MKKTLFCFVPAFGFFVGASGLMAQPVARDVVRLFNVLPMVSSFVSPDQLNEVAFSLENRAGRDLEWDRPSVAAVFGLYYFPANSFIITI